MAVSCRNLNLGRAARLAAFVMVLTAAGGGVARAQDETPAAPSSQFQYATLVGSGTTITAMRIPVVTADGVRTYRDMTMQFEMDSEGNLVIMGGYPLWVPSPDLQVFSFRAGRYVGPKNVAKGKGIITVGGPGVSGGGGSVWSFAASDDADACTYPGSATWYVGPIENSPVAARLKKAGSTVGGSDRVVGITSTAWSYGVSGVGAASNCPGNSYFTWPNGALIGVSQSGNTLTIASFTDANKNDYSSPIDQITYVLAP